MIFKKFLLVTVTLIPHFVLSGSIPPPPVSKRIKVRKCCDSTSAYHDGSEYAPCQRIQSDIKPWQPVFTYGSENLPPIAFEFLFGFPNCKSRKPWPVYGHPFSCDKLIILEDGRLRHNVSENLNVSDCEEDIRSLDYNVSEYCMDQVIFSENITKIGEIAFLCVPTNEIPWHDPHTVLLRVVHPLFRAVAIVCLLSVAIIYVVLPQLCDLVGNIITTISICLIFTQVADIIQIYEEYHSKSSFLIANSIMYTSSLGTFFWLNSLGYYIWRTFRSRNVFLRATDGRKYCCYAAYSWGSTISIAAMALFAHVFLDTSVIAKPKSVAEAAIGSLGVAVFLTTITYTIIVNIFFCFSTLQIMNRMSTYGRIHHKLKYNFHLFIKLFIIITVNWFVFMLSWFHIHGLFYFHIGVTLLQAFGILYAAVLSVKKVRYLLSTACCHEKCILTCCRPGDPGDINEWGEEMMAMNVRS